MNRWEYEADAHWKEHLPTMYRELKESGELKQALHKAAARTAKEYDALLDSGMSHHQAWGLVKEKYLFLPEEEGVTPEPGPEDNPYHGVMKDAMELRAMINQAFDDLPDNQT